MNQKQDHAEHDQGRHEERDDVTVLRSDPSISKSWSQEGSGEADAPRVLKQRFVLEEKLGSGGMGTVFRAKDLRKVEARDRQPFLAIKVLNNDFREHPEAFIALQREAVKSQTLSHPNIVSIYDFDKDGDVPFMTMELLEGQELAQLLRAYPTGLPETMAWEVIRGICGGLAHAHAAGIVHADFKPGNVYVAPNNAPKILDFGIARAVQLTEAYGDDTLFDPARLAALTPAYASREMLAGDNPEPRDDLYSLGIVIYLILTGHHPYGRLSADDAAREGLKAERPKSLSRRQWQVINRCLSFNRQDRPENIAELERLLLTPSPWRSRSIAAAAAVLLVTLSVNYLIGDAELSEVKQEVRKTTLLDAQLARLAVLLESPVVDENWERDVAGEFSALAALKDTAGAEARIAARIQDVYASHILSLDDLDAALGLLDRAVARYGAMPEVAALLEDRAIDQVRQLLGQAGTDLAWLEALKAELDRVHARFPDSPDLAELDLEVGETLELLVLDAVAQDRIEEAEQLLSELTPRLFDVVTADELRKSVADARNRAIALDLAQQIARQQQARTEQLDEALAVSCLRLDLPRIQALAEDFLAAAAVNEKVSGRFSTCLAQLAELDPDRAAAMQSEIMTRFGESLSLEDVAVDPCSLNYLVGNGAQPGRQGYCADGLRNEQQGPRLVVIPPVEGAERFAITKQEVSWAQFRRFCVELEGCSQAELESLEMDDRLPVTGVSLATVRAFAAWLSDSTGYRYRLPTLAEWHRAAQGDPDPNRNCRVQLNGVQRGLAPVAAGSGQSNDYGLVNMLGNVQEWVTGDDGLVAVGGSFTDPISMCLVTTEREHGGEAAVDTGFRLVRELS